MTVELGTLEGTVERFAATAVVTEGAERDRLYAGQADRDPGFAAYQAATDRVIPVVALHRVDLGDPARHRAIADHLVKVHAELRAELTALREGLDSAATEVAGTVGGVGAVGAAGGVGSRLGGEGHPAARPPTRPPLPDLLRRAARPPPQRGRRLRPPGARVPELSDAMDRMREEHKVVARTVEELEALLTSGAAPATLRAEVDRLATRLGEHFTYEEAQLVPALTRTRAVPGT